MKRCIQFLSLFFLGLTACTGLPPLQDAYEPITPAALPTSTSLPTPTPILEAAEGVGRAFYRAWEGMDFAGMYSLLSPQSQALVSQSAFVELYQSAMTTASLRSSSLRCRTRRNGERQKLRWPTV